MKDQCGNELGKNSFVEKNRKFRKLFRKRRIGVKKRRKPCLIAKKKKQWY